MCSHLRLPPSKLRRSRPLQVEEDMSRPVLKMLTPHILHLHNRRRRRRRRICNNQNKHANRRRHSNRRHRRTRKTRKMITNHP